MKNDERGFFFPKRHKREGFGQIGVKAFYGGTTLELMALFDIWYDIDRGRRGEGAWDGLTCRQSPTCVTITHCLPLPAGEKSLLSV